MVKKRKPKSRLVQAILVLLFLVLLMLLLVTSMIAYFLYTELTYNYEVQNNNTLRVEFNNIPSIQQEEIGKIIKSIDSIYLEGTNRMIIESNRTILKDLCEKSTNEEKCDFIAGLNINKGQAIYIWNGSNDLPKTICHELLHTNWVGSHESVYALADKGVCFK